MDVLQILSNKSKCKKPIFIKPDRTPEQQKSDYILRSERKRLIDSGTSPSDIKIKGTKLYVKNVVHGSIVGSVFSVAQKDQYDCSPLRVNRSNTD